MSRRILGIDPSLTGTGLAVITAGRVRLRTVDAGRRRGHDRLAYVVNEVSREATPESLAVIEGPSYGSQAGQQGHHERAGLWWMITHRLWQRHIAYAVVAPAVLKRYAAGKGNAHKDQVLAATIRRYGQLAEVDDNNQADALILAAMAADQLGIAIVGAPATHRVALSAVDWPDPLSHNVKE